MIKRLLSYFFIFIALSVFQVILCATESFTLGTFRLFTDAKICLLVISKSIIAFLGIMVCTLFLIWGDWILSETLHVSISYRAKKSHKISILAFYRLTIALMVIITAIYFFRKIPVDYQRQKTVSQMRNFMVEERFIIHAGGYINGDDYTNSKEAIENCYRCGNKICEVDIMKTTDGELVLAHDSDDGYWARGTELEDVPTLDEFLLQKIDGKYTPMSMDDLANFMRSSEDFYIVTDIKDEKIENITKIAEDYPDLRNRIIVQIYHEDEYDTVSQLGFPYIIYTLYEAGEDELSTESLSQASVKDDLVGFTFWSDWTMKDDFMEEMRKTETPLFVHTLNTREEIHYALLDGISGIYTDLTDLEAYRGL